MNEVRAITLFTRAATLGSLRKAAVDQGISPQAASHSVKQLEKELGVRLFHRTTRKLSLTEEGQRFFDSVKPALRILSSAIYDARRTKDEVAGSLRVGAPRAFAKSLIWPHLDAFASRYPEVQLDIQLDDAFTDLIQERIDVGFRGGAAPADGLIARMLSPIQLIVCAAPSYLERYGTPRSIDDLEQHRCTGYRRANTGKQAPWEFQVGREIVYRDVVPALCTNDVDIEVEAVLAGRGIGQLGSFSAANHIRAGRLIPLFLQHITQREAIYIYYGHRTEQPLRVRTFIDFMVARMSGNADLHLSTAELRKHGASARLSSGKVDHQ